MDVSIVTGTYNRLPSLQRMVESVYKSSFAYGLTVEIVLVDGGSTDGTIEWCKSQPDIFLIEQGQLLGAVRAFNEGAYVAHGNYVILANDDIEFIGQTIVRAFIYMESHLDCGMGCIYQDRERQHLPDNDPGKWYVAEMPVVVNNQQTSRPYGQVCIVPKWLGDRLGWWGSYLHTYGGDNELTANVYEAGYKVSPIPGTKMTDHEIQDGLRRINNLGHGKDPKRTGGHHPDSWAWGKHWQFADRRNSQGQILTGPTVRTIPRMHNPIEPKQRIVYLPIFEQGWAAQKEQKRGLREALAKVGVVFEYDYMADASNRYNVLSKFDELLELSQPTLVLTQLHNADVINGGDIRARKSNKVNWVNWNGDFWPEQLTSSAGLDLARSFDLQLGVNRDAIQKQKEAGINAAYWQIGYEPDGVGYQADVFCDLAFLGSGYSQARQELVKKLRSHKFNFHLYGPAWKEGWSKGVTIYDFKAGCKIYQGAKLGLGDSQWPETGFVSNRVFQILAAGGCALIHQWFKDMDKLGLIDGETCIIWREYNELIDKIFYYLNHEEDRKRIAQAGQEMCLARHSFDQRVKELFDMIAPKSLSWRW